jgi:tungstate transport system permease protein
VIHLWHDALRAVVLILTGDPEVWQVAGVSLEVSVAALALACVAGIPLAYSLAFSETRAARLASWLLHTLTALPTVVVGLGLYFLLSASGPFGWMDVLYTRVAMVTGQFVLGLPIVAAVSLTALRGLPREARETAATLGLAGVTRMRVLLAEVQGPLLSAILIAFARVFTELGAAVILGGNIRGRTRTLTTVIALEYTKGEDARAIALGIILMAVALTVNAILHAATLWRPAPAERAPIQVVEN